MKNLSTSNPQRESYADLRRREIVEQRDTFKIERDKRFGDTMNQKNDLEYDLRTTDWILQKARESEIYAQNLYAAMCNNEFVKLDDTWNILKENYWGVTWRTAGGIIADMREEGDYMDWYCSGISQPNTGNVSEGVVTQEIKDDLKQLGWAVIHDNETL